MWESLAGPEPSATATTVRDQREKELLQNPQWWGLMVGRGRKTFRHTDDKRFALQIVEYLISLRRQAVLDIQNQLVDEEKSLQDMSAGMEVERELLQAKARFSKDLEELKEEQDQALQERDNNLFEILRLESEEREEDLVRAEESQRALQTNFRQLLDESEARHNRVLQQLEKQLEQKGEDNRNSSDALRRSEERTMPDFVSGRRQSRKRGDSTKIHRSSTAKHS